MVNKLAVLLSSPKLINQTITSDGLRRNLGKHICVNNRSAELCENVDGFYVGSDTRRLQDEEGIIIPYKIGQKTLYRVYMIKLEGNYG